MSESKNILLGSAFVVRDETNSGGNTAARIGQLFIDIINAVDSVDTRLTALSNLVNTIIASGDGDGSISLELLASWEGSESITTLGTITTGTWQGSVISSNYIQEADPVWTAWLEGELGQRLTALLGVLSIDANGKLRIDADTYSTQGISAYGDSDDDELDAACYFSDLKDNIIQNPTDYEGKAWGYNGTSWGFVSAGDKITKAAVEAVLTGNITTHTHSLTETDPVWSAWLAGEKGQQLLQLLEVISIDDNNRLKLDADTYSTHGISAYGDSDDEEEYTTYFAELTDVKALAFSAPDSGKTIVWNGTAWSKGTAGDEVTKDSVESVLTGDITTHTHSIYATKTELEEVELVHAKSLVDLDKRTKAVESHVSATDVHVSTTDRSNWNTNVTNLTTHKDNKSNPHSVTKAQVGLSLVENTKLSTWGGSENVSTLGTITTGVWKGTKIGSGYITEADPVFMAHQAHFITKEMIDVLKKITLDASGNVKIDTNAYTTGGFSAYSDTEYEDGYFDVSIEGSNSGNCITSATFDGGSLILTRGDIASQISNISGLRIEQCSSLPASPNSNTLYIVI